MDFEQTEFDLHGRATEGDDLTELLLGRLAVAELQMDLRQLEASIGVIRIALQYPLELDHRGPQLALRPVFERLYEAFAFLVTRLAKLPEPECGCPKREEEQQ